MDTKIRQDSHHTCRPDMSSLNRSRQCRSKSLQADIPTTSRHFSYQENIPAPLWSKHHLLLMLKRSAAGDKEAQFAVGQYGYSRLFLACCATAHAILHGIASEQECQTVAKALSTSTYNKALEMTYRQWFRYLLQNPSRDPSRYLIELTAEWSQCLLAECDQCINTYDASSTTSLLTIYGSDSCSDTITVAEYPPNKIATDGAIETLLSLRDAARNEQNSLTPTLLETLEDSLSFLVNNRYLAEMGDLTTRDWRRFLQTKRGLKNHTHYQRLKRSRDTSGIIMASVLQGGKSKSIPIEKD